ncbi:MAG TPA: BLUF domain-containing protein [Amaricoccus sp.]|jgi:hypothetical protein|nr:BLUF domain-containing protein [Amaricoccus sp.]
MLERIVFVSRAAPGLGREALYAIVREAHARNPGAGLTGALVQLDGCFAQLLEGPATPLAFAFGRIGRDPRHGALELRAREPALCRLFPGQALALRTRACLDPGLLEAFGYHPGFPVAGFPSDVLVEFLVGACRREAGARRAAR